MGNFESFLKTGSPLWFRDLYSLGKLENQKISDDESVKNHIINSDQLQKEFAGHGFGLI